LPVPFLAPYTPSCLASSMVIHQPFEAVVDLVPWVWIVRNEIGEADALS